MTAWAWTPGNELPTKSVFVWAWSLRVAAGTVAFLGGPGGVGKSVLVAALEVAVATGRTFLDRETLHGDVWHLDFDTDARLQGPWYSRVAAGMDVDPRALGRIRYGAPGGKGAPFLTVERLEALAADVAKSPPVLVVVDAWSSAFPFIRGNDAGEVAGLMASLRELARLGPAVLVLDHLPKPVAGGPPTLERGLLGSVAKGAGSRAVYLLNRVAPREVEGRDVQRLDCLKNNLAPIEEPLGIERIWTPGGVSFHTCDLPSDDETRAPALGRAMRAVRDCLNGQPVPRRELLRQVVRLANCSERTAASALGRLSDAGEVEKVELDGRSLAYRLPIDATAGDPLHAASVGGNAISSEPEPVQRSLHELSGLHQSENGDGYQPPPEPF